MFIYCNGKKWFIFVDYGIVFEIIVVVYWKRSVDLVFVNNFLFGYIEMDLFCFWIYLFDSRILGNGIGNNWDI